MESLSGIWQGSYKFDPEISKNEKEYKFKMHLKEDDGDLNGEVTEIMEEGEQPPTASVEGFVMDSEISFIKQYPYLYLKGENNEVIIDENKEHPEIHYHGELQGETIQGTWEFELGVRLVAGSYYPKIISGTWQMNKVE